MLKMMVPVLCITSVASASWICPVFRTETVDPSNLDALEASALLDSWEVVITPLPVTDETVLQYLAEWDYLVSERLSMTPVSDNGCILFCFDLGVEPERTRQLMSVTADGVEVMPCSTLARPWFPADHVPGADTLYLLRHDPFQPEPRVYVLDDVEDYRQRFESEDWFLEAIPQTARFWGVIYDIHSDGEPFDIEVVYIVRGWTWLDGGIPLEFSLFQPGMWEGRVEEATFLLDFSGIPDAGDWLTEFSGEHLPAEGSIRIRTENFELAAPGDCPVLVVKPPGIQTR